MHLLAYAIGLLLLAPCTTSALELGEASIKSGLGQSLLVEIPYRLGGNERISSACVGLAPAEHAADALPTYVRVSRISITPTHIEIFDERSVLEPLIDLNVDVHCAGAPRFVRSYQLFVDPPSQIPSILSNGPEVAAARTRPAIDVARTSAAISAPTSATGVDSARANASPRARGLTGGNVPQGQSYRVVRGDTLSGIAARITGRPVTILEAADAIFAANPAAFTRGNPDLIEEGRSITIPNLPSSQASIAATAAPAPAAVREAELPTAAPVAAVDPAPAPANATEPSPAIEAASGTAAEPSQPIAAPAVATPSTAPVAEPTRATVAPAAPDPAAAGKISASFIALITLAAVILLSASVAFVRRRRKQQAAEQAASNVREPLRRRPVELASRMNVVEGSLSDTHAAKLAAAMRTVESAPLADAGAAVPPDLKDIALNVGPTDAVDFNVGAPVVTNEPVAKAAHKPVAESDRPYIIDARDDTLEESFPTAQMRAVAAEPTVRQPAPSSKPDDSEPINDEQHTLTVVELDMLREDYETEHTLTQQSSQALRDALADLAATKASHAATAETATLESPQVSQEETTAESPTARVRAK